LCGVRVDAEDACDTREEGVYVPSGRQGGIRL
jgi:hypothetical protein